MPTEPKPDRFDEGLRWVRDLARSLVADASLADDLAQETMLVAMERAPRNSGSLRAWLARVLRNRLWLHRRTEDRRRRREQSSSRPEGTPSDDELLERVEAVEQLGAAVRRLSEPYRRVILLRYFDDISTAEISKQLGIPESTVRTRLERARSQLKRLLDAEFGDRKRWAVALLPLAGYPDASGVAAATLLSTGSGLITMKKFAAAILLVALLIGGYVGLESWNARSTPDHAGDRVGAATSIESDSTENIGDDDAAVARNSRGNPDPAAGSTPERGENPVVAEAGSDRDSDEPVAIVSGLIYRTDGASLEGSRVLLWGGGQPGSAVDAEGRFRIEAGHEMGTTVFLEENGKKIALNAPVRPSFDEETVLEIEVDVAHSATVELIDRFTRRAVPDAKVVVRRSSLDAQASSIFATVDAEGVATFDYLPEGEYKVEVEHPRYTPEEFSFRIPRDQPVLCELSPARSLEVTMVGYDAYPPQSRVYLQIYDGKGANIMAQGEPNEFGEFAVNAPAPGDWAGEMFSGSGFPRVRFNLRIPEGTSPVPLELKLPRVSANQLVGVVLDGIGDPLGAEGLLQVGRRSGRIAVDGTIEIDHVEPGPQEVRWVVGANDERVERTLPSVDLPDKLTVNHEFVIDGSARLEVSLRGLNDTLRADRHAVRLFRVDGESRETVAWGFGALLPSLVFDRLPVGKYEVVLHLGTGGDILPPQEIELKAEGSTQLTIEVPPPARIELDLATPSHVTLPTVAHLEIVHPNRAMPQRRVVEVKDGKGQLEVYAEGKVELVVAFEGYVAPRMAIELRPGEATGAVVKSVSPTSSPR